MQIVFCQDWLHAAHLEDALLVCFSFGSFCSLLTLSLQLLGPREQLPSDGRTHSSHCVIWQGDKTAMLQCATSTRSNYFAFSDGCTQSESLI